MIQPALGFMHHRHFVATGGRGAVSHAHIWWGRALLVLGVINGGIGLEMALERQSLIIAYSVVAAVTFAAYFLSKVATSLGGRRARSGKEFGSPRQEVPRRPYQSSRTDRHAPYV